MTPDVEHWHAHPLVATALELAEDLLDGDASRWRHTRAVAARAAEAVAVLPADHAPVLLAAAWLHDIGYAPAVRDSGFHPLDGAQYLTACGWQPLVAGLVAHHSGARHVAHVRDLDQKISAYDDPASWQGPLADALTWADQTTGPDGREVDVHTRIADMLRRHGPDSPNARAHPLRGPELQRAVADTEDRLLVRRAGQRLAGRS